MDLDFTVHKGETKDQYFARLSKQNASVKLSTDELKKLKEHEIKVMKQQEESIKYTRSLEKTNRHDPNVFSHV